LARRATVFVFLTSAFWQGKPVGAVGLEVDKAARIAAQPEKPRLAGVRPGWEKYGEPPAPGNDDRCVSHPRSNSSAESIDDDIPF
jgi:hypothetical protein